MNPSLAKEIVDRSGVCVILRSSSGEVITYHIDITVLSPLVHCMRSPAGEVITLTSLRCPWFIVDLNNNQNTHFINILFGRFIIEIINIVLDIWWWIHYVPSYFQLSINDRTVFITDYLFFCTIKKFLNKCGLKGNLQCISLFKIIRNYMQAIFKHMQVIRMHIT